VEADGDVESYWVPVRYAPAGGWWERLPLPHGLRAPLRARREMREGLSGHVDVSFFNTQVPAVIGPRRVRHDPYVVCTDITPVQYDRMAAAYGHRADGRSPLGAVKTRWNRQVLLGARACVAWSSWVRDSLVGDYGVPAARVHVIPPGVDLDRWRPSTDRSDTGPVRVLFVGADFERKGGPLLLEAFGRLPAGSAELHVVTKSQLDTPPGVTVHRDFAPNDPGLIELYGRCHVFVLPSAAEAFGIAAAEAAAAGLPVIASRVGGLVDIVLDERTGYLVPPDDVDALARRLQQLVGDRDVRERLGAAGAEHAAAQFDGAANARRILAVLREGRRA
jgi:glycosyltransferase involved in cell wall biosynthesis